MFGIHLKASFCGSLSPDVLPPAPENYLRIPGLRTKVEMGRAEMERLAALRHEVHSFHACMPLEDTLQSQRGLEKDCNLAEGITEVFVQVYLLLISDGSKIWTRTHVLCGKLDVYSVTRAPRFYGSPSWVLSLLQISESNELYTIKLKKWMI